MEQRTKRIGVPEMEAGRGNSVPKGTVTPLADAEEVSKAARRVEESLAEPQKELEKLQQFKHDNRNLMNLVQKLPDQLSYNIMVPFGKAAFFPGRLIHTNELLVLLGESYYAECTAKQTLEILHRRSKLLDAKIEGVNAITNDLCAEASFFTSTAADAAEGVMEIREEYIEPKEEETAAELGSSAAAKDIDHQTNESKEFDRIMARLDELEQEEANAITEEDESGSEDEISRTEIDDREDRSDAYSKSKGGQSINVGNGSETKAVEELVMQSSLKQVSSPIHKMGTVTVNSPGDIMKFEESKAKEKSFKEEPTSLLRESLPESVLGSLPLEASKAGKQVFKLESSHDITALNVESNDKIFHDPTKVQEKEQKTDTRKAFTGRIVEHTSSEESRMTQLNTPQGMSKKPSRPLSRFKMQKGASSS